MSQRQLPKGHPTSPHAAMAGESGTPAGAFQWGDHINAFWISIKWKFPTGHSSVSPIYETLSRDHFIHQTRISVISWVQPLLLKLVLNWKTMKSRMYMCEYTHTHTYLCVCVYYICTRTYIHVHSFCVYVHIYKDTHTWSFYHYAESKIMLK